MTKIRVGHLYSLSPIHCGGEGDLGNILDIAREAHTSFPYIPGSSLRGGIRYDVEDYQGLEVANRLFGKELKDSEPMGVHQVWFGDARLLWVPMRTLSIKGKDVFVWVSCHSLLRDYALVAKQPKAVFPEHPVGDKAGNCMVADATLSIRPLNADQRSAISMAGDWHSDLKKATYPTWEKSRIVLPDSDFQILMEHSLWTQIRNKIDEKTGSAGVFWTDVCIPRDTILYYTWGYNVHKSDPIQESDHASLAYVLQGLLQVGGQANVGRGWAQSWIANAKSPLPKSQNIAQDTATVGG